MIEAVLFDMDGVVIDSEHSVREAEVETFKKFGVPATIELISQYTGIRFDEETEDIGKRFGVNLSIDEVARVQQQIMKYYYRKVIPLVPFIQETLKVLRPKYALGLATSCDRENANLVLQRFNLLPYFKALTFGEDVTRGKPDPEIFLRTAKLLGIDPTRCAVVEDSNPGFKAGKAAGMLVIARRGNHNMDTNFSPTDFIVEDVRKIPKILSSQS